MPPVQEPVSLAEAKGFARIQYTNEDSTVQDLITAAREYAETDQKRAIPTQVFQLISMGFPWTGGYYNRMIRSMGPNPWWLPTAQGIIQIPHPMVQMVLSVQYIDPASGLIDYILPSNYIFSYNSTPGRIMPQYGAVWPLSRPQIDSVSITFVAGYGTTPQGNPQSQTLAVQGTPASGTFTLTWQGQTTSALAYNCTAAQVQAAVTALSNVGSNNVACIGGPFPVAPVILTWTGTLGAPATYQPLITATSSFTGAGQPAVLTNMAPVMPSSTRTAIRQIVADNFENREATMERAMIVTPTAERMLMPERWGSYV